MSVAKSEIKLAAFQEVGKKLDNMVTKDQQELERLRGAKQAFVEAAKRVEAILSRINAEIDEGKIEIPIAQVAKRFVTDGVIELKEIARTSNKGIAQLTGRIEGMERSIEVAKKLFEVEEGKIRLVEQREAAQEQGENVIPLASRPVGTRPPQTIKQQRQALEASGAAEPPEAAKVEESTSPPKAKAKPARKLRKSPAKPRTRKKKEEGTTATAKSQVDGTNS